MLDFQLKIALSDIIQQREEKQNKTKRGKKNKKIRLQIPFFAMKKKKTQNKTKSHKCRLNEDLGILQSSPSGA